MVESEGCTLHYRYQGSGPLLVLIAGGGGNSEILEWYPVVAALSLYRRLLSTDEGTYEVAWSGLCYPAIPVT